MEYGSRDKFDTRHGGPFDRGSADNYYRRSFDPHYYVGDTGMSDRVEKEDMTTDELEAYAAGFKWNEKFGGKKDYE
jgi:hypothetical protein